jgi:hypothetical protein
MTHVKLIKGERKMTNKVKLQLINNATGEVDKEVNITNTVGNIFKDALRNTYLRHSGLRYTNGYGHHGSPKDWVLALHDKKHNIDASGYYSDIMNTENGGGWSAGLVGYVRGFRGVIESTGGGSGIYQSSMSGQVPGTKKRKFTYEWAPTQGNGTIASIGFYNEDSWGLIGQGLVQHYSITGMRSGYERYIGYKSNVGTDNHTQLVFIDMYTNDTWQQTKDIYFVNSDTFVVEDKISLNLPDGDMNYGDSSEKMKLCYANGKFYKFYGTSGYTSLGYYVCDAVVKTWEYKSVAYNLDLSTLTPELQTYYLNNPNNTWGGPNIKNWGQPTKAGVTADDTTLYFTMNSYSHGLQIIVAVNIADDTTKAVLPLLQYGNDLQYVGVCPKTKKFLVSRYNCVYVLDDILNCMTPYDAATKTGGLAQIVGTCPKHKISYGLQLGQAGDINGTSYYGYYSDVNNIQPDYLFLDAKGDMYVKRARMNGTVETPYDGEPGNWGIMGPACKGNFFTYADLPTEITKTADQSLRLEYTMEI